MLDSVSVEMRKTCLDEAAAADFVEAAAADPDLDSADNEAAAEAADQKKQRGQNYYYLNPAEDSAA